MTGFFNTGATGASGVSTLAGDVTGPAGSNSIKSSVALTGAPTAPTATAGTDTTQIATTAFVLGQASTATTIRSTTGAPTVLSTDIVGDFAVDTSVAGVTVLYGPLTGTPTVGQSWNYTGASAAMQVMVSPNLTQLLGSGYTAESIPGTLVSGGALTLASGTLQMAAVYLPIGTVISNLVFQIGSQGMVTPTHQWGALYDLNLVQLATSVDKTTTAFAAYGVPYYGIANIASGAATKFVTTYSGLHYVGWCVVAETMPNANGLHAQARSYIAPFPGGTSDTGQTTPPSFPHTATGISVTSLMYAATA